MRIITLAIAILICTAADAQIIRAEPFYTAPEEAAAPLGDLLLDSFPGAAAAYSLRKLDKDYTGSAIRVRRSSDNTEQDIGFVNNYLDTAAMKTFVGANNGFVVTWYNQADSSGFFGVRNATQGTAANQPRIINSGAIDYKDGEVAIHYTGSSNQTLEVSNSNSTFKFLHDGTTSFFIGVISVGTSSNPAFERCIFRNSSGSTSVGVFAYYDDVGQDDVIAVQINRGVSATSAALNTSANGQFAANVQRLLAMRFDADNATAANRSVINVNNGADIKNNTTTNAPSSANSTNNLIIGDGVFGNFVGHHQELIIYGSDQSTNRSGLQTNINSFYSIY